MPHLIPTDDEDMEEPVCRQTSMSEEPSVAAATNCSGVESSGAFGSLATLGEADGRRLKTRVSRWRAPLLYMDVQHCPASSRHNH